LHKVVKSSQAVNIDGVVSIDNTVIIKQKPVFFSNEGDESKDNSVLIQEYEERIRQFEINIQSQYQSKLKEFEKEKDQILIDAVAQAKLITRKAEEEALVMKELAKKNGYKHGYDEGFNDGSKKATGELESQLNAVTSLLKQLNENRDDIYIKNENEIIDLAYQLTQKITLSEIKTDKDIIFAIVKQACKNFRNSDYVKISLAKCDVSQSVVTDEKLLRQIAGNIPEVEIELLQDAKSGTVIIDNDKEIIDASVPTQLDFLKQVLNAGKKSLNEE